MELERVCSDIDRYIDDIVISKADKVTLSYINKKVTELDEKKNSIQEEIDRLKAEKDKKETTNYKELKNVMNNWDKLSFDDKRSVIELLIIKIVVYPDKVEILWKV
ncbi:MAG: hypothetical protein IJ806_04665 [Ruminococcus sp.]|nr:hypothetical protein [Ruminococcus sp.]